MSARPLAILHVDPERGLAGGEQQVLGLLAHLHAAGHRQCLAADPHGPLATRATALGVTVASLAIRNHFDVLAARRLRTLLAAEHYDVVHFHTARAHAMSAFLGARRVPRVVTRRMDYRLRGGWWTRRLYNREVDAVVAISEGVRAALIASGVAPARITVVPSGVDAARFAPTVERRIEARARFGLGDDAFVLATVGVLEERKGHDLLLDALAALRAPALRLVVAGTGSRAAWLAERARTLGLVPHVQFLGPLDDVVPVLAAADALVMPSRHEGLGVAALEAMAAGLPVVASGVGGLPDAVRDGETGLLVPPGDPAALATAIARLAADRDAARAFGAAGAARVRARFTIAAMAEGTLAVYRRLAATHEEVTTRHG